MTRRCSGFISDSAPPTVWRCRAEVVVCQRSDPFDLAAGSTTSSFFVVPWRPKRRRRSTTWAPLASQERIESSASGPSMSTTGSSSSRGTALMAGPTGGGSSGVNEPTPARGPVNSFNRIGLSRLQRVAQEQIVAVPAGAQEAAPDSALGQQLSALHHAQPLLGSPAGHNRGHRQERFVEQAVMHELA